MRLNEFKKIDVPTSIRTRQNKKNFMNFWKACIRNSTDLLEEVIGGKYFILYIFSFLIVFCEFESPL